MSLLIAGTGTDVGKTMVSAAIMARYAKHRKLRYLKPVQTGSDSDRLKVAELTALPQNYFLPEYAHYDFAASPHYAAEVAQKPIDYPSLLECVANHVRQGNTLIEFAGGLMVPLTRYRTNLDLARDLALPVVLVARTNLGTINHTLLSLMAMRHAGVTCAGLVFFGPDNELYQDNRRTIAEMTGVQILSELLIAESVNLDAENFHSLAADFDKDGLIARLL
jgi:dethiobiotin synthetase